MNNSFPRLIDAVCATLHDEVLSRIDDEYARSQIYGVINLLNTFRVRADWSAGFLLQQLQAQRQALGIVAERLAGVPGAPSVTPPELAAPSPIADLLASRDEANRCIGEVLAWLASSGTSLSQDQAKAIEQPLREAMRAEVEIELAHSPRPLFAEMSGGG
jgi:hypothetical protein